MCKIEFPENINTISVNLMQKIIAKTDFHIEYSPIVSIDSGEVYAYESSGRFEYSGENLSRDDSLEICYGDIDVFFELDLVLKKEQFSKRPKDKKLFISYDLDALVNEEKKNRALRSFIKEENFTINLSNNNNKNVELKKLVRLFNSKNSFTVENVFEKSSMISMYYLNECEYIILDKDVLNELKRNKPFFNIIEGIRAFSYDKNRKIICKGVDCLSEFELAKSINADFIQGSYALRVKV